MNIQQGDIYKLDEHIIACGDSLDASFVSKVIGDKKIRAIVTDPPYGVDYIEGKKFLNQKLGVDGNKNIIGDQLQTDEEYAIFTKSWLVPVIPFLEPYNACYIFNSDLMFPALRQGMKEAGFHYSQMIIWFKNQVVMNRKDYLMMFELIAYGWFGKHKMERSKAKSVLIHPKPSKSKLHPTQKPVGLLRKLIPNSTKINEYVYDPFLGSGSTTIACEHLGRRCIGIEIDPEYVATSIARWEKLTGRKAEKYEG
jgi:site-specific DNA-methyltransferase (adenine-specific)